MTVTLHDGRKLDSQHFSIFDKNRPLEKLEKFGIALGWSMCAETPKHSIVITKWDGVFAKAFGYKTPHEAIREAQRQLGEYRLRDERFHQKMVAILNFAPNHGEATLISATGVDVLFVPAESGTLAAQREESLEHVWLGRGKPAVGRIEKRALIMPRYKRVRTAA